MILGCRIHAHTGVTHRQQRVVPGRGDLELAIVGFIKVTLAVSKVSFPPWGMASWALTARFIRTCSIWPGSALIFPQGRIKFRDQSDILADQTPQHILGCP